MEVSILLALQSMRIDGLVQLAALVSACGNKGFIWLLLAVVLLIFPEKRRAGALIIISIIVAFVLSELLLDPLVARVRPCDAGVGIEAVMGVSHSGNSFPSGHTLSSFCAATVLALTLGKKWGTPAFAFAVVMAFTRLYLGVHWPTDILGGAVIGIAIGVLVVWVYNTFFYGSSSGSTGPKTRVIRRG